MRFAVLPAAGKSSRMGRPKLSLPLGQRTILEHVVAALRQAHVEHVLVVLGPHVGELAPLARTAGAHVCQLAEQTTDMRATVEQGLHWLEERFQPRRMICGCSSPPIIPPSHRPSWTNWSKLAANISNAPSWCRRSTTGADILWR